MKKTLVIIIALVAAYASGFFVYSSLNHVFPEWMTLGPQSASSFSASEYDQNSSVPVFESSSSDSSFDSLAPRSPPPADEVGSSSSSRKPGFKTILQE
jgi:hypothetical protein